MSNCPENQRTLSFIQYKGHSYVAGHELKKVEGHLDPEIIWLLEKIFQEKMYSPELVLVLLSLSSSVNSKKDKK